MTAKPYVTESLRRRATLWVLAFLLMAVAAVYQKRTGPTYEHRGAVESAGERYSYALIRSDWSDKTNDAARVILPDTGPASHGTLNWKRFHTGDAFTATPLQREDVDGETKLVGLLPAQPAAGKLEYFVELTADDGSTWRIPEAGPEAGGENIVMRFKDHVPIWILAPHVIMMFFTVLIGMRTGLAAIFAPSGMRRWSWVALIGMTIGGMVLGPIVQKYAFGAYWTGFPWGGDWTDNKMLVMWLSWVFACGVIGFRPKRNELIPRVAVVIGALAMTAAFMIPHSMGGSELNYDAVDAGLDPSQAIQTGLQE